MSLELFSLNGKVAIVTGGSKGLGKAMSLALAEAGADVVIASRTLNLLEGVAEEIRSRGVRAIPVKTDLTKTSDVQNLVGETLEEFGRIDILVNNAGRGLVVPFLKMAEEEWDSVMDINLKGYVLCSQAVGREMVKQKSGRIINISSVLGTSGIAYMTAYCASKAAIMALTRALAVEWSRYGINVNAIAPSWFETEITEPTRKEARFKKANEYILERTPLGKWGKPNDVTGAVVFLASDASSYITGEVINVDGGWMAW
jgi:NAD(P)-dependent dehydrogenase (short-subunit alcohol dehydrogenase family)